MLESNPYKKNPYYTFISKSRVFEIKNSRMPQAVGQARIRHGRTYEYSTKCSASERIWAIMLTVMTLCAALMSNVIYRKAIQGKRVFKEIILCPVDITQKIVKSEIYLMPRANLIKKLDAEYEQPTELGEEGDVEFTFNFLSKNQLDIRPTKLKDLKLQENWSQKFNREILKSNLCLKRKEINCELFGRILHMATIHGRISSLD